MLRLGRERGRGAHAGNWKETEGGGGVLGGAAKRRTLGLGREGGWEKLMLGLGRERGLGAHTRNWKETEVEV